MQFRVLGPLEVVDDDGALVRLGSARERYVLATLLVSADRLVPAERLIDALWDEPPPTARQQLQNLIASLRRRLAPHAPDLVATRPFGYELQMGPHTLDLAEFRRLVADARAADRPEEAARDLEHAVSLWRGAALGDVAPAADASTETLQQALHDERVAAVDLLVDALDQLGRHDDVLTVAGAQLEHDPWNERLLEHRLRALAATGRRSEATEAYRRLRRRFIDELGVPPNRSLAELNTRILEGGPLVAPVARHRVVPRELPAPTWTLVGREALLGAVLTRLAPRAPDDRRGSRSVVAAAAQAARPPALVVLVGVGGVGKTALAVTAGHALADAYPDGTLYASLDGGRAGAVDPHDVAARFLRALGVDGTSIPAGREDRIALYRTTIAGRRLLTVIDGAATESQVRPLLPTSPGSGAIVTSRSRLAGLVGVRRHTVQPLTPEDSLALLAELSGPERDVRADAAGPSPTSPRSAATYPSPCAWPARSSRRTPRSSCPSCVTGSRSSTHASTSCRPATSTCAPASSRPCRTSPARPGALPPPRRGPRPRLAGVGRAAAAPRGRTRDRGPPRARRAHRPAPRRADGTRRRRPAPLPGAQPRR